MSQKEESPGSWPGPGVLRLTVSDDTRKPKPRVDIFASHLKWCLRDRPKLKDHPVVAALLDLYVVRLRVYVALPFFVRTFEALGQKLQSDLKELGGWSFTKRGVKFTDRDDDELGNLLVNIGYSYQSAKTKSRKITALSGGRPPSRRQSVIAGMELRLQNPSLTWWDVTERVCPCGKQKHDSFCQDNLITGQKELRRLLRKYDHPLGKSLGG